MKIGFRVLKDRHTISVEMTRNSVCAGDDCDAPHTKTIELHSFLDPVEFTREASSGYLPQVAGVGHSWICVLNETQIAKITTSDIQPLVREVEFGDINKIHFVYNSSTY